MWRILPLCLIIKYTVNHSCLGRYHGNFQFLEFCYSGRLGEWTYFLIFIIKEKKANVCNVSKWSMSVKYRALTRVQSSALASNEWNGHNWKSIVFWYMNGMIVGYARYSLENITCTFHCHLCRETIVTDVKFLYEPDPQLSFVEFVV